MARFFEKVHRSDLFPVPRSGIPEYPGKWLREGDLVHSVSGVRIVSEVVQVGRPFQPRYVKFGGTAYRLEPISGFGAALSTPCQEGSVKKPTKLSARMREAILLIARHGAVRRRLGWERVWVPGDHVNDLRHDGRVDTTTINALERRGLVQTDDDGKPWYERPGDPPDLRATLTEAGVQAAREMGWSPAPTSESEES